MAERIKISVVINGNSLNTISRVLLNQNIFDHHHFEVFTPMRTLVDIEGKEDPLPSLKQIIGKDIEISVATATFDDQEGEKDSFNFKGIVTDINVNGNVWSHAHVSIKGKSPTVLMDGIQNLQSYSDLGIAKIYDTCIAKHLSDKIKVNENLTYTEKLRYTVQYNESDFEFIKRICYEYGQWFYYDGNRLCLGLNPSSKKSTLKRNRIHQLNYDYSLASTVPGIKARDYKKHELKLYDYNSQKHKVSDDMASNSISESYSLFTGSSDCYLNHPTYPSTDKMQFEEDQIVHKLKVKGDSAMANVLTVRGETDVAAIQLGSIVKLDGFHHSGEFVVVSVTHSCMDSKSYSNQFTAIPKDSLFPLKSPVKFPKIGDCTAHVTDNDDPQKMGRVRVKFDWSEEMETPWIRVSQPHAGDKRGLYFTPEVGDEVMVGFEMDKPEFPYVIGALYNGKNLNKGAYNSKNELKVIRTRSGNEIQFDDGGSGKMIFKNQNNEIELNCESDGSITIKSNGDINIEAGKNMALNIGQNLAINVGNNFALSVGNDLEAAAGSKGTIKSNGNLVIESQSNIEASASRNLELKGGTKTEISGAQTKVAGSASAELSSAATTIKGGIVKIN